MIIGGDDGVVIIPYFCSYSRLVNVTSDEEVMDLGREIVRILDPELLYSRVATYWVATTTGGSGRLYFRDISK